MRLCRCVILVNGTITVAGNQPRDKQNRPLILKNNAPFVSRITRINNELIEDADDLDIVMLMMIWRLAPGISETLALGVWPCLV